MIMANPDLAEDALSGVETFPNLTEEKRLSLLGRAQARAEAEKTKERNQVKLLVKDHIASIEATGVGIEGLNPASQTCLMKTRSTPSSETFATRPQPTKQSSQSASCRP